MNKEEVIYPSMVIRSQSEAIKLLEKQNKDLQQRIDKAIEILKLCNSKCAKETIEILGGKE